MKLTAQVKLLCSPEQSDALRCTLEVTNTACNYISRIAWQSQTFRQFDLHRLCYRQVRQQFGLTAQAAVRAISKVADAYKLDKQVQRSFQPHGAAAYDSRILAYSGASVSIWTWGGRMNIPFTCGDHQRRLLASQKGESDLALIRGQWYLLATCEVPASGKRQGPAMGVDLGIRNTAATSNGTLHCGAVRQQYRAKCHKVRASLQSRNTRRARQALRRQAGRERRRITWENHNLSKAIVAEAEGTQCGTIRMERLAGIRHRCKIFNKHTNRMMSGWSYGQLQAFSAYKAERAGLENEYVEPAYTSQTCSKCGELGIRRGDVFSCTTCGKCHADTNASVNIAGGGVAKGAKHRARKPARITAKCKSVLHVKSRLL